MKKIDIKIKNSIYLTLFLVLIIIVFLFVFVLVPSVKKAYSTKDELDHKKLQFERMQGDAVKAKEYSELVAGLQEEEEMLGRAIIKREDIVSFFKELELISERSGNSISISHVKEVGTPKELEDPTLTNVERAQKEAILKNTVRLLIVVEGNYRQFLDFFYKVNNMPYIFDIQSVSVKSAEQANVLVDVDQIVSDYTNAEIKISFIVD